MEERSSGIILRTRPLTETSLIVHWLTADLGRISTVAKGARRPKSPFLGKLDLYYEADFSFARSRRSELHTLREVMLRDTHPKLRENLTWLQQAAYFGILIEKATEIDTPLPEIFALLRDVLMTLPTMPPSASYVLAFELKLLALLGFQPNLGSARLAEGSRHIAIHLLRNDWNSLKNLKLSKPQQQELNRVLLRAIETALERVPPQREKALSI